MRELEEAPRAADISRIVGARASDSGVVDQGNTSEATRNVKSRHLEAREALSEK